VAVVVTQPDRPSGRGREMAPSPVKQAALRHGLPVCQPERIRRPEAIAVQMAGLNAEVMVVVGYGQIIPQAIIDLPPHGIINVHASLLPKYRGAAPIQWATGERRDANRRHHHADRRRARHRRHPVAGRNRH
jgi:methionyl-tRNA formyltransferase